MLVGSVQPATETCNLQLTSFSSFFLSKNIYPKLSLKINFQIAVIRKTRFQMTINQFIRMTIRQRKSKQIRKIFVRFSKSGFPKLSHYQGFRNATLL